MPNQTTLFSEINLQSSCPSGNLLKETKDKSRDCEQMCSFSVMLDDIVISNNI